MRTIDELAMEARFAAAHDEREVVEELVREAHRLGKAEERKRALTACRRNLYVHTPMDSYAEEAEGVRRAIVEIMHADDFPEEPLCTCAGRMPHEPEPGRCPGHPKKGVAT